MTEKDFYLLCAGFKERELIKAREQRQLMYIIVCGYADPKKLPPIHRWMPLEGDPIAIVSDEKVNQMLDKWNKLRK